MANAASADDKYSVLMSVYYKEKPEYLQQSIESILNQTMPTDDFVLVCDGPLTPELDAVIEEYTHTPAVAVVQDADHQPCVEHKDSNADQQDHVVDAEQQSCIHVIRLKENGGLGNALNEGMKYCRHELIARMDSDDISRSDRCERELKVFEDHPEVDIVSGTIEEFITSPDEVYSRRVLPETNDEIVEFAKKRNPFNHPAVMYRKSAVEAAGGYKDFYLLEDYFLWVRMILRGSKGYNIQEPVLWMRAGSDLYKRRSGWKYVGSEKKLFSYMLTRGFISKGEYMSAVLSRTAGAMVPNWLRSVLYKRMLRG